MVFCWRDPFHRTDVLLTATAQHLGASLEKNPNISVKKYPWTQMTLVLIGQVFICSRVQGQKTKAKQVAFFGIFQVLPSPMMPVFH